MAGKLALKKANLATIKNAPYANDFDSKMALFRTKRSISNPGFE
jgi:hypothetical protein